MAPLDHGAAQSLLGEADLVQQMHGPLVHDTTDTPYARVSVEGAAISLADAVAVAIVRHPDVAQAAAALARGRADLGAARSVWLPSVSYSANIGPNTFSGRGDTGLNDNVGGPNVTLNQMVYDFGRSRAEIAGARATEKQRSYEMAAVADALAETTSIAYMENMRFAALAEEAKRNVEELDKLRGLIQLRVDAGISDRSDLMLAEVRLDSARAEEIQARSALISARVALANLVGGMPASLSNPEAIIVGFAERDGEPDYSELPQIAAAEQAENAAQSRIGQAKAERYPRLGLQLGYTRNNYTYNTNDNAFTAMITVSGEAYRPASGYLVEAAEQERNAARAQKNSVILDLRGRALTAREEIAGGMLRVSTYRRQEANASQAMTIFLEEYKLGKRTLTDLLNARAEIYRAARDRISGEQDILIAKIRYENLFGQLRRSLGLPDNLLGES